MFSSNQTQVVAAGGTTDPYFNYVTALLHGDGTNGGQNNTFIDSSTNNYSITRNGNTTQGSWNPFGSLWSNYFNGTNAYLTMGSSTPMNFGTSNFTIECWINTGDKSISGGASRTIIGNSGNSYTMQLYIDITSARATFGNTGSTFLQGTTNLADGKWHHIAVSRSGTSTNQIALFVDGVREALGTNSLNYASSTIYIGSFDNAGNGYWSGYISNLRIVNGTSLYSPSSTTITVPTSQLTAVANTSLLICQSNRFVDNSGNALVNNISGSPWVQNFSPFAPTAAYSTSVNGGSGYFDGSGDYLKTTSTQIIPASTTYTVEACIYLTGNYSVYRDIVSQGTSGNSNRWLIYIEQTTGVLRVQSGATSISSGVVIAPNQWYYFAFVNNAGSYNFYVNNTSFASGSNSTTPQNTNLIVGSFDGASEFFQGYISNLRISNTARTASVPTAPFTSDANTTFLVNFTNGAIFDNAYKNDFETVGNAQISTSVVKYGTGSLAFDGTGDWLLGSNTPNVGLGTGSFTVEMWVYPTTNTGNGPGTLFDARTGTNAEGWVLRIFSDLSVGFYDGPNNLYQQTAANAISLNTWTHLAFVRNGTTLTIYVNGTSAKTASLTSNLGTSWPFYVGNNYAVGYTYTGYIDDLRITKGIARYTTNFTPPTAAFPNQ